MPFTPFHFGPGAAIKAAAPNQFSFTVFCFAQVVTDCETAYYMLRDMYPWHRFFHTYVGAILVAFFSVLAGRPLCQIALRIWCSWPAAPFKRFFTTGTVIPMRSAISGAFIGTTSHVFLDGIMHDDVTPFLPFSASHPLHQIVSLSALHIGCIILGLFGAFFIARANRNG